MSSTKQMQLNKEMLEASNLPQRFWDLDIERYKGAPSALRAVQAYTKNFAAMRRDCVGLFFVGKSESYKTFLASYVGMYALCHSWSVSYYSMSEIVDGMFANELKASHLKAADLTVIDNLTFESNTFWPTALARTLTYRRDAGKPTILCTRLKPDKLEAAYGKDNVELIQSLTQEIATHVDSKVIHAQRDAARLPLFEEVEN